MSDLSGKTLLEKYFLKEKKPSGQIADVYHAWDKQRTAEVAVKILRRDFSSNPEFKQYFSTEAELMARLDHPNIVRLYEFCDDGQTMFIVMDWVDGSNLKDLITTRNKPFSLNDIVAIYKPVCSALNYAHLQKIIHCDIKPANIMIDSVGKVLLTDFGISRYANQQNTGGTPPYMAPEQFDSGRLTSQTDVYALGVTLYELLSGGKVPFRGDTPQTKGTTLKDRIYWEIKNLPYPNVRLINPDVPEVVDAIICKALQKSANQRQSGAVEFYRELETAMGGGGAAKSFPSTTFLPGVGNIQKPVGISKSPPPIPRQNSNKNISPRLPGRYRGSFLVCMSGQYRGNCILLNQQTTTVGRSSQNMLNLDDISVSRKHAAFHISKQGVFISDQGSKGGTFLNGRRIVRMERLQPGDVVLIGLNERFEFRFR
jgi:serine/threonine-protein kinase